MDVGDKDEMTNFHQTTPLNGHWTTITNLTEFLIFSMKIFKYTTLYILDVLCRQQIKLFQVVSTSEFYNMQIEIFWGHEVLKLHF